MLETLLDLALTLLYGRSEAKASESAVLADRARQRRRRERAAAAQGS